MASVDLDAGEPLLDRTLTPHRSMSPRTFGRIVAAFAVVTAAGAAALTAAGAWPAAPFLGIDVALLWVGLRWSARAAAARERIVLTPRALTISRIDPQGRGETRALAPYWLSVRLEERAGGQLRLALASHGRETVVGGFLDPEAKRALAAELTAALDRLRRPIAS